MKNYRIILQVLALILLISACKDKEVTPDLAETAVGTYKITSVTDNNTSISTSIPSSANYTVSIARTAVNQAEMIQKIGTNVSSLSLTLGGSKENITIDYKDSSVILKGSIVSKVLTYIITDGVDKYSVTAIKN